VVKSRKLQPNNGKIFASKVHLRRASTIDNKVTHTCVCNQVQIHVQKHKVIGSETAHLRAETEFRKGETP